MIRDSGTCLIRPSWISGTIDWNEQEQNKNCYIGYGAQEQISNGQSVTSIQECLQLCEDHDYCNCITFINNQCYLRRDCNTCQCRYHSAAISVTGTRLSSITACSPGRNPCENGGTCSLSSTGGAICSCSPGFGGNNCEENGVSPTINWNEPQENRNCYYGRGSRRDITLRDGNSRYYGISSVEECQQRCEDHETCNCITLIYQQCWLRQDCDIERCRFHNGAISVTGTRGYSSNEEVAQEEESIILLTPDVMTKALAIVGVFATAYVSWQRLRTKFYVKIEDLEI